MILDWVENNIKHLYKLTFYPIIEVFVVPITEVVSVIWWNKLIIKRNCLDIWTKKIEHLCKLTLYPIIEVYILIQWNNQIINYPLTFNFGEKKLPLNFFLLSYTYLSFQISYLINGYMNYKNCSDTIFYFYWKKKLNVYKIIIYLNSIKILNSLPSITFQCFSHEEQKFLIFIICGRQWAP